MARSHSDDEAMRRFHCGSCEAKPGAPCTYTTGTVYDRQSRIGKPMLQVHNDRRYRLGRARAIEKRDRELADAIAGAPPWLPAMRQFDRDEEERMRQWLRANWLLFGSVSPI